MQIMQHKQDAVQKNTHNFQFDFTEFERGQKSREEDINSKLIAAECYLKGDGIKKDIEQGLKLLEDVIEKNGNNRIVELKLAMLFLFCKEIEQNRIRAIEYFKKVISHDLSSPKTVRQAEVQARTMLGICYYYEYGVKDNDSALNCFIKSSEQRDDSVGHLWLACIYQLKNKQQFEGSNIECYQQPWWHPTHSENIHAKYPQQEIDKLLCRAAAGFFLKDDGYDYTDQDIIDFIFPENEIISFLEHQKFSDSKVILAFYYHCKNEKNKSLELLKLADKENKIIASFALGKHYKELDNFDEAIIYFNTVEQRKNSPFIKEYQKKYDKDINQWLALLAVEELKSIDNIKHLKELEEKNKALESEIKQKKSLQNRMQKLVEQFTHSLGNVIFPDTIYQVAERWKNNPECRKDVLLLNEAYHSEIIIKLQGELLRQRYANTNPEKFRQFIRSCRRLPNNTDNTKSIEDILDYAASRVTARFLNQHYAGLNTIRDKILAKKGADINALKQKFENDILLNKSSRPIAWINENLRPVQITEISPLWKKVCILAESHAEALLFGYFSEILFNAFKYADHDKDEFLTLVFDESVINDKNYLSCSWKNPVKDKTPLLGTGKGLDAIQEDLKQLNDTENPEQSLLVQQQNNQFQVTLFFNKDLLIDDLPILTRKRKTIEANHA